MNDEIASQPTRPTVPGQDSNPASQLPSATNQHPASSNRKLTKVIRIIARLNVGGPAKHVAWLTAGLQDQEWETVLVAGSVPPGEEDMGYFAAALGVQPVLIKEMSREISFKDAVTIWKLYRLFKREQPDLVHTHTAKAGTVGRIAGLLYRWFTPGTLIGRPRHCLFIHTYHGHIFHGYYGQLKTRVFLLIEKLLARLITDKIVVVSQQQKTEINQTFGVGSADQLVVIPLGLDLSTFAEPEKRREIFREELGVKPDQLLVGIVGRLTEVKNHELFLKAVAQFKRRRSAAELTEKARFVVIGDGSLRESLKQTTRNLGLVDDIIFAGTRSDPENFYPALDVVALTSKNEGTPLTLIEAMANGVPVISSAVGGVVDLVGAREVESEQQYQICQRGITVRPQDAAAFALGLERLLQDPNLRKEMGRRGREFVAQNYSRDRLLDDMRTLYRSLRRSLAYSQNPGTTKQGIESRVS